MSPIACDESHTFSATVAVDTPPMSPLISPFSVLAETFININHKTKSSVWIRISIVLPRFYHDISSMKQTWLNWFSTDAVVETENWNRRWSSEKSKTKQIFYLLHLQNQDRGRWRYMQRTLQQQLSRATPCCGSLVSERILPEQLRTTAWTRCLHIHMEHRALLCGNNLISELPYKPTMYDKIDYWSWKTGE